MSNRPAFSERALQMVAEDKIQAAIAAGEFERLPGLGKPLKLLDEPYDSLWWVRGKMQREQLTPTDVNWIADAFER